MKRVSFIVPEGDFSIVSTGTVLTTQGIRASALRIEEVQDAHADS